MKPEKYRKKKLNISSHSKGENYMTNLLKKNYFEVLQNCRKYALVFKVSHICMVKYNLNEKAYAW